MATNSTRKTAAAKGITVVKETAATKPATSRARKPVAAKANGTTAATPKATPAATLTEDEATSRAAKAQATRAEAAASGQTRTCAGECGETKPITKFPTTSANKDGVMGRGTVCRACRDAARKAVKK